MSIPMSLQLPTGADPIACLQKVISGPPHSSVSSVAAKTIENLLLPKTKIYEGEEQEQEQEHEAGDLERNLHWQMKELGLTSKNPLMKDQIRKLPRVASVDLPILILGPSGSGKERIASAVHHLSPRKYGPYVRLNCSALTESLAESELFGHTKGSFTGALTDRKGVFETARGGTLFLDEVGDLPLSLQAKLLRALENKEIRPVGSDKNIKTNVRIVAATHQDLGSKIKNGEFRADLYYRLNVVQLKTPALVDRMEDFMDLVLEFSRANHIECSFSALEKLRNYSWPGNIRELQNTIARLGAFYPQEEITAEKLDILWDQLQLQWGHTNANSMGGRLQGVGGHEFTSETGPESSASGASIAPQTYAQLKEREKELIQDTLKACRGNQRKVAQLLGIPKSTLHDRIRQYGIDPRVYKLASFSARGISGF